jgi:hypothetical protein
MSNLVAYKNKYVSRKTASIYDEARFTKQVFQVKFEMPSCQWHQLPHELQITD